MDGALRLPRPTLEDLADATRTPLPWREPAAPTTHAHVPRILVDALATFGAPVVLVTVDLTIGDRRLRSWQRRRGDRVTALSAAGPDRLELAWFDIARWRAYLVRTASPAGPARATVAARTGGRNRVGWVEATDPATFADRVLHLVAGAHS